jgi:hypothetical protein
MAALLNSVTSKGPLNRAHTYNASAVTPVRSCCFEGPPTRVGSCDHDRPGRIQSWVPSVLVTKPSRDMTILSTAFLSLMAVETYPIA